MATKNSGLWLGSALLLLFGGALSLWHWLESPGPPVEEPAVDAPAETRPLVVTRTPVVETHAAPRADGLEGVEACWVELNNEATLLLGDGELARAVEMFARCHAALPDRNVFRRNLAEALIRLARARYEERALIEAIEQLARAIELAPEREDVAALKTLRERWRSEVELEENHFTEGSDLFDLSYDANRRDLLDNAQRVLDHLAEAYEELRLWFGRDPVRDGGRDRIRVVLYNHEEFDRITGLGDWAGGVFDGVVRVSVEELNLGDARWRRVLTHELVHAFLHELGGPRVPGWLNEGLAQFLERDQASLDSARRRLGEAPFFPLEQLEGSLASWDSKDAITRAYAQSLILVDFLHQQYGDDVLRAMVFGCAHGKAPGDTFRELIDVPLSFTLEVLPR